ncbi:MAG: PHB depolymerase family esterase [Gemmobacter sp.]|nr:PHB depolymerase family esterase [Gemmobacter sp.]
MKFTFATALRRATRLTRARLTRAGNAGSATSAMQRAIGGAMARSVVASLSVLAPGKPKPATKPRKSKAKMPRKGTSPKSPSADRRLSVVLRQLRAAKAAMPGPFLLSGQAGPSKHPAIPKGARYLERTHTSSAGARDFKLYLPARHPGGPKGLIVMLHGCSQDPDDFAIGTNMNTIAQKHGLAVAYPAQTRSHNAASCWNWFAPANQSRGAGEPAVIAGIARGLMREFDLERHQVFVAGLSAGGAMAVILADTYPDVFAAAGVHSGLARGAANNLLTALSAMRSGGTPDQPAASRRKGAAQSMRRIIFHGDADDTVHPSNAAQIVARAVGRRTPDRVGPSSAAGRDYVRSEYQLPDGTVDLELWQLTGAGHAWSGGKAGGTYTDPEGPDASAEMVRFFLGKAD